MKTKSDLENITSIEELLADWKLEMQRRNRRLRFSARLLIGVMGAYTVMMSIGYLGSVYHWWGRLPGFVYALWPLPMFFVPFAFIFSMSFLTRSFLARRKTHTLPYFVKSEDVRAAGPLVHALFSVSLVPDAEIAEALCRLLPRLTASDTEALNREQYRLLCRIARPKFVYNQRDLIEIDTSARIALQLATIEALKQIGDSMAVPGVEALANLDVTPESAQERAVVRDAAQSCLPFLRERAERERTGKNLLRASGDPAVDSLLTPAMIAAPTEPQQLLRAGVAPESRE